MIAREKLFFALNHFITKADAINSSLPHCGGRTPHWRLAPRIRCRRDPDRPGFRHSASALHKPLSGCRRDLTFHLWDRLACDASQEWGDFTQEIASTLRSRTDPEGRSAIVRAKQWRCKGGACVLRTTVPCDQQAFGERRVQSQARSCARTSSSVRGSMHQRQDQDVPATRPESGLISL